MWHFSLQPLHLLTGDYGEPRFEGEVNRTNAANFNLLNMKRRLLYLKTQFVPRSKHFSSRL